jgi:PAS domain S-box-containing protein
MSGIEYKEEFLLDDNNWIATEQCYKLAANITLNFPEEEQLFHRIALWTVQQRLSKSIWAIAGSTVSPYDLYNSLSKNIVRFNRHRKYEINQIGKGKAIIKLKHMTHIHAQKEICQWTGGLIEAAPLTIGYPPANVKKISCECNGEEYCIYEVKWKNKIKFFQRINNILFHKKDIFKLQSEALEESLEKLLERYEKLLESEKKYRTLIETIRDIVYTIDKKGHFTYISPNVEKITGFPPNELIGKHFINILSSSYRNKVVDSFNNNLKNRQPKTLGIKIITKDKTEVPMELNTTMLYDAHGSIIGRIGVARDITRRRQEEAKRKEIEVKALTQDKLASLGEIATGIAHEINQPLSYIKIILQSTLNDISKEKLDTEELTDDFQESLRQVGKISNIISHLRTFGRSDVTSFGPVSLSKVLNDTLILMKERLRIKNISMNIEISDAHPMVNGNHIKLEQVFLNLIQNSMDALEEQGKGEINLSAQVESDHTLISFSDTGKGIKSEIQEKVFEPFFTTKEADKGTGIGLSIVYGIIQEHQGVINCESEGESGATFKIKLPIYNNKMGDVVAEPLHT